MLFGGGAMTDWSHVFARSPLYAVVFHATNLDVPYVPVIGVQPDLDLDFAVTVPHGLGREVAVALPGLWYCLHLPNTFHDLTDIPARGLKASQILHLDHHILLVPIEAFDREHVGEWLGRDAAALVVCPDDILDDATTRSAALGFALPPAPYSQLSNESLRVHWKEIHAKFVPEIPYLGREPVLIDRLDLAPTDLPQRWLSRQFGWSQNSRFVANGDVDGLVAETVRKQAVLAATARLERENTTPEAAEKLFDQVIEEERRRLRIPVVLALPGVAPAYVRGTYGPSLRSRIAPLSSVDEADRWSIALHERADPLVERAAIEFLATHRAIARSGIGLMLPTVPPEAFVVLAELERHFEGTKHRGSVVSRMLEKLDRVTQPMWTESLYRLVASASSLTVFSNFPIGLLRLPGDTSPLCTRLPITYRPLQPLTRSVQHELQPIPPIDLSAGIRVLVAECIGHDDPVGTASRAGWEVAAEHIRTAGERITIDVVDTLSVEALRSAISAQSRTSL
jgi:hypothetical protein